LSIPANAIELKRLLAVADREVSDAGVEGLSADGKFEHSYNAALTLATIVIRAHGERVHGTDHHRLSFERFAQLLDGRWSNLADYFQHCRRRRNTTVYDMSGSVSEAEAAELASTTRALRVEVRAWLKEAKRDLT
jgi:hypothetical protein